MNLNDNQGLSPGDPSSFSRPDSTLVKDIHINWDVDFQQSKLKGYVDLRLEHRSGKSESSLILDTRDLTIIKVHEVGNGKADLEYSMGDPVGSFGSKLDIKLSSTITTVRIHYETAPSSSALQWFKPEQTAGKKHPYLFSQCQAIHARSMLPCQDTPSVKTGYSAIVSVPKELVALMSAIRDGEENSTDPNKKVYKFNQKVPLPSYLIAIAVGALQSKKIGPRSHVWTEKEFLEASAYEFAEVEDILKTAESFLGPYVWGIYDLLVLPPSFPYGGMENPCLTFLTPTLLAGDRSLVNVVAHEIGHSWTGNLVTNRNFEHFWLNEGFTVFVERKIVSRLTNEKHRHFHALGGWKELQNEVDNLGKDSSLTKLVVDLTGVDPDDAFSTVPYEKGHTFLFYLEELLGGNEVFEKFLRAYIEEFKYKTVDSDIFKEYLYQYFKEKTNILDAVDWKAWLYGTGMPPIKPQYDTSLANLCIDLCKKWTDSSLDEVKTFSNSDVKTFNSLQSIEFLELLLQEKTPWPTEKFEVMSNLYEYEKSQNNEIRYRWLLLGLRHRSNKTVPLALAFVTQIGRMKYIRPLYRELYNWEDVRNQAIETFQKQQPNMMYVSAYTVSKDLHLN